MSNALNWLREHRKCLSLRGINDHLKMPVDTLQKAVTGAQNLPKKWVGTLNEFVERIKE